jgi:hypothetical protein
MRGSVLVLAVLGMAGTIAGWPSDALGDSCITLEGSAVINRCQACMKVTIRELRPRGEQGEGIYREEHRSVRVEAGERVTLQNRERSTITDISACN